MRFVYINRDKFKNSTKYWLSARMHLRTPTHSDIADTSYISKQESIVVQQHHTEFSFLVVGFGDFPPSLFYFPWF